MSNNCLLKNGSQSFSTIKTMIMTMMILLRTIKMGTCDEVHFTCKLSVKGKKAKWYIKNQVKYRKRRNTFVLPKIIFHE